ENIGPDLDGLANDPFGRESAAVDKRVDVFDVDAATGKVADRGEAHVRGHVSIVLCHRRSAGETAGKWNRSLPFLVPCRHGGLPNIERVAGIRRCGLARAPGLRRDENPDAPVRSTRVFRTSAETPGWCNSGMQEGMEDVVKSAARLGLQSEYWNAFGELRAVSPDVLRKLVDALGPAPDAAAQARPRSIVVRREGQG